MRGAGAVSRAIVLGVRALVGAQARWLGCGPSKTQRIYFANHTSHFDLLLVLAALPNSLRANTRPVAAADYWHGNALRSYLVDEVFHAVLIDRLCAHARADPLSPLIDALDQGHSLLFFPEGTRGSGEGLLPFKTGIYHVAAARPEIDLVPVWMDNAYRVMPKGSLFPIPLLCAITFGEPLRLREHEGKEQFLQRLNARLTSLADGRAA